MAKEVVVTREGYNKLEQELENLVQLRHQLEQRLQADLAYWTYRFRRVLA